MAQMDRKTSFMRAKYGWPQGQVPFSAVTFHDPDGYRCDDTGYLSMIWDIPLAGTHGGMNAVTLEEWVVEIPPIELKLGDAIGLLGPASAGQNTIVYFEDWLNGDHTSMYALTWEMLSDASPGPIRRARPWSGSLRAYRFRDMVD